MCSKPTVIPGVIAVLILGYFLAGCAGTRTEIGQAQAIAIARASAERNQWNLADYRIDRVREDKREFAISFEGIQRRPGNHFTVYVDRKTGDSYLIPGR